MISTKMLPMECKETTKDIELFLESGHSFGVQVVVSGEAKWGE